MSLAKIPPDPDTKSFSFSRVRILFVLFTNLRTTSLLTLGIHLMFLYGIHVDPRVPLRQKKLKWAPCVILDPFNSQLN